jgi:hypothetical protein
VSVTNTATFSGLLPCANALLKDLRLLILTRLLLHERKEGTFQWNKQLHCGAVAIWLIF